MLSPTGEVENALRDSYDHAFIVLALSWLVKVTDEARVKNILNETLAFLDEYMTDTDGSLFEGVPHKLPRRQNPQMHMFEAMIALHETINHPSALPRADRLLALMHNHLFDTETGTLGEFFAQDWSRSSLFDSDMTEPGHQAEWCWLLRRYEKMKGLPSGQLASQLLDSALPTADAATGLLIDQADRFMNVRAATKRTWPQTEITKAWVAEAEAGRPGAAEEAQKALARLFKHYIDQPFEGGWIDQLDANNQVIPGPVLASTFYHIFVAIAEADRVLSAQNATHIQQAA